MRDLPNIPQAAQFAKLLHGKSGVLVLPHVERRLAEALLAAI